MESKDRTEAEEPGTRFHCLCKELVGRGLPESEARTEVARIVARELWDKFASQLRHHRAAGHQMDANVLAVALGSIQCMAVPLARHRGDAISAGIAVSKARGRLQRIGGLMDRLHTHAHPAFKEADMILQSLEDFLSRSRPKASAAGQLMG